MDGDTCAHPVNTSDASALAKQRCRDNRCIKLGTMPLIALPQCGFQFAGGQVALEAPAAPGGSDVEWRDKMNFYMVLHCFGGQLPSGKSKPGYRARLGVE